MCVRVCSRVLVMGLTVGRGWGAVDEMGSRIDDLEKSISDLMQQANIDAE